MSMVEGRRQALSYIPKVRELVCPVTPPPLQWFKLNCFRSVGLSKSHHTRIPLSPCLSSLFARTPLGNNKPFLKLVKSEGRGRGGRNPS